MPTVLIIEDDPLILRFLSEVLEDNTHHVVGIDRFDHDPALLAERACPDIVIVDLKMRTAVAGKTIGRYFYERGISVLYTTGNGEEMLIDLHGNGLLFKPYRIGDIESAMRIIVKPQRERGDKAWPLNFRLLRDRRSENIVELDDASG